MSPHTPPLTPPQDTSCQSLRDYCSDTSVIYSSQKPPDFRDPRAAKTRGPYTASMTHPHALFPGEKSEAHTQEGTCPRSRSQLVAEPGLDPVTQFRAHVVSTTFRGWRQRSWSWDVGPGPELWGRQVAHNCWAHRCACCHSKPFTLRSFQWANT